MSELKFQQTAGGHEILSALLDPGAPEFLVIAQNKRYFHLRTGKQPDQLTISKDESRHLGHSDAEINRTAYHPITAVKQY